MVIRNILVPAWPGSVADRPLDAALGIARRLGGHINALFIRPDAAFLRGLLADYGLDPVVSPEGIGREGERLLGVAQARFEEWRQRNGLPAALSGAPLPTNFACWEERAGSPDVAIVQRGRLSDLIALDLPGRSALAQRVFEAAVFETGRPVLLAPAQLPADPLRHVVVSWNGSLEATRAVAAALPMLHAADQVTIVSAQWRADASFSDDPFVEDLDLAGALSWHGVQARTRRLDETDPSVGAAVLRAAREGGGTLLVLGAYTRSRVTERLWGGVTRHVLHHADIPVLMAH